MSRCAIALMPAMARVARAVLLLVAGVAAGVAHAAGPAEPDRVIPLEAIRSGITFQPASVRAMQADEFANPAQLWLDRGQTLWSAPAGASGRSCASCHGDASSSMKGLAAHYPRFDTALGRLVNLAGRIDACRVGHQQAEPFKPESDDAIGILAHVTAQSRGLPISVSIDGPARAHFEAGRSLYYRRMGQMNLACNHCHEQNWGRQLLAETISQGHPNAYPIYRLEWQKAGTLHRRFRSCLSGVRAEMWPYGAPEYLDLELFLAWRARGLAFETPGVRK
jgi:sulfur-oxidizing protein SoxA